MAKFWWPNHRSATSQPASQHKRETTLCGYINAYKCCLEVPAMYTFSFSRPLASSIYILRTNKTNSPRRRDFFLAFGSLGDVASSYSSLASSSKKRCIYETLESVSVYCLHPFSSRDAVNSMFAETL